MIALRHGGNWLRSTLAVALWALPLAGPAWADGEAPATNAEIAHLMQFIRSSGCEFQRNGSWYAPADAHDHIARKLNHMRDRSTIPSAEAFIQEAATRSSISGESYQVRCPGAPLQECRDWLRAELGRARQRGARRP